MLTNLFGKYLTEEGILSNDELADIIVSLGKNRVKLGLIALSEGILSKEQTDEINRKQAIMDKRFGDIAIELGYLKSDQVSYLLDMQGNAYMQLCQAITDSGKMTVNEINDAFNKMLVKYNISADKADGIKADDIDAIVEGLMGDMTKESLDLTSIVIRTVNRLISTDILVGKYEVKSVYEADKIAYQTLEGDYRSIISISGDSEGMLELASIFGQEEFDTLDMDSLDAIGEFLNIVNGLYATGLSYRKIDVELQAPMLCDFNTSLPFEDVYVIPLEINKKALDIILKVQK